MELVTYMKDTRCECLPLTARSMAAFVRESYPEWLMLYVEDKKDASTAYESLLRLLRRFAYRHGFVQRTPSGLKVLSFLCISCCTNIDFALFTCIRKKLTTFKPFTLNSLPSLTRNLAHIRQVQYTTQTKPEYTMTPLRQKYCHLKVRRRSYMPNKDTLQE